MAETEGPGVKSWSRVLWGVALAGVAWSAQSAEIELEGNRLLVTGMLDGSAVQRFTEELGSGKVRTVVFENSLSGTAEAAGEYARAIRASGVNTEMKGQCHSACAYAFLAGKEHRFGRGFHVNALLIPVAARPRPEELASRWLGEEAQKTLAEFAAAPADAEAAGGPRERWQPGHVLFTSTLHFSAASTTASIATARRGTTRHAASCCRMPTRTSSAC
ncbi:hypothetical protein [Variovorax soli]|uniref:Uncharacterized protein n=1 Tax=Variovorax soli TaxID=376815 RepID=A0ABU1NM96_9BURK|nr:hypothetical protein [Variovorax soli]MDR6539567.1 hypothetical protein [Variovorax soli]